MTRDDAITLAESFLGRHLADHDYLRAVEPAFVISANQLTAFQQSFPSAKLGPTLERND